MKECILGFILGTTIAVLSGCGSDAQSISKVVGGTGSAPIIVVSLNDAFTTVIPNGSEKVQLADSRYFTPPSKVDIVQGSYAGSNPGQYLHARLLVGNEICEYQNTGINDPVLSLMFCSGGIGANTYLPAGTVLELVNYDAPGYLLQADFTLVK